MSDGALFVEGEVRRVRSGAVLSEWSDGGGRMTMLKRLVLATVMVAFMAAMLLTVPTGVSWV